MSTYSIFIMTVDPEWSPAVSVPCVTVVLTKHPVLNVVRTSRVQCSEPRTPRISF